MPNNKRVLFMTNGEYGPAKLVLAIAFELVVQGCEVHIASFLAEKELGSSLRQRLDDLNNGEYGSLPKDCKPIILYSVEGQSVEYRYLTNNNIDPEGYSAIKKSGVRAAFGKYKTIMHIYSFHDPKYMKISTELSSIIHNVKPNVVVVDYLCAEAREAAKLLSLRHYVILSHSSSKAILTGGRLGYRLWNFSSELTGSRFPMPWYIKILHLCLSLHGNIAVLFTPGFKRILKLAFDQNFKGKLPLLFETYTEAVEYLVPSAREIDFPYSKVPTNVTTCGPIHPQAPLLSAKDPSLERWLRMKPTVMMNLGSSYITSESQAESIAMSFLTLLQRLPDIQVLWKLAAKPGKDAKARAVLERHLENGSVKIVDWLEADSSSILQTGFVKCYIHSGGPTSYYEAIDAGVASIIIHCWFDTFDFTARIEYLGIGLWGNQLARSKGELVDAEELGDTLLTIMDPANAKGMKIIKKATELREIIKKYDGRKKAAEKIMWLAEVGGYGYKEGYGLASADRSTAPPVSETVPEIGSAL